MVLHNPARSQFFNHSIVSWSNSISSSGSLWVLLSLDLSSVLRINIIFRWRDGMRDCQPTLILQHFGNCACMLSISAQCDNISKDAKLFFNDKANCWHCIYIASHISKLEQYGTWVCSSVKISVTSLTLLLPMKYWNSLKSSSSESENEETRHLKGTCDRAIGAVEYRSSNRHFLKICTPQLELHLYWPFWTASVLRRHCSGTFTVCLSNSMSPGPDRSRPVQMIFWDRDRTGPAVQKEKKDRNDPPVLPRSLRPDRQPRCGPGRSLYSVGPVGRPDFRPDRQNSDIWLCIYLGSSIWNYIYTNVT